MTDFINSQLSIDAVPKVLEILLVEDGETDYVLTRELLRTTYGEGFELDWVSTWDTALEALQSKKYDVCLVDYNLGDWNGLDFLREAIGAGANVPFIMLTGLDNRRVDIEAIQLGAADYLAKDEISSPVLKRSVRLALARQQHLMEERDSKDLLEKANQKLSERYNTAHRFVDNVSHEFRTPLAVIKDFASILADGLAGDINGEQQEYLGIVINRVDDLAVMVDDMLDISKLEAGLLCVKREEHTIDSIVSNVSATLERKAAANGTTLSVAIEPSLPTLYCDAEKIGRVITNLTVNAFKFSNQTGTVTLWARDDSANGQVVIGVTDQGPGIGPENVQAIFNRFKQVGGEVRSSTKGFGLGLNIVKELVHLNLGDIFVKSEVGKGSTFSFTVPVYDPPRVLDRFIDRIEEFRDGSPIVSLITARMAVDEGIGSVEAVEHFLQNQLRRTDLMFRVKDGTWVLAAATSKQQLDKVLSRLGSAWNDFNRHRPNAPLPAIDYDINGTWRIGDQNADFTEAFDRVFDGRSVLPANDPELEVSEVIE